jgi:actin-related protein
MEHDNIPIWEGLEEIWRHTFYNELQVAPEEQLVLMKALTGMGASEM